MHAHDVMLYAVQRFNTLYDQAEQLNAGCARISKRLQQTDAHTAEFLASTTALKAQRWVGGTCGLVVHTTPSIRHFCQYLVFSGVCPMFLYVVAFAVVLCCVVLCCVVLCCVVLCGLCCVVLCCVVWCGVVLCCVVLRRVVLCCHALAALILEQRSTSGSV